MAHTPNIIRFGPFEFDPGTAELHRDGKPVRLQPLPSQLLAVLVASAGRLVTRDELRDRVWDGRVIEFEGGINFAVRQVRKALSDAADRPLYVETVHGRGYRFIGKIVDAPEPAVASARMSIRWKTGATVVATLVALVVAGVAWGTRPSGANLTDGSRVMVAVLPFEAIDGETTPSPFSLGLTEDLIAELALVGLDRLGVIAPSSVFAVRSPDPSATDLRDRLGVDYAVRGTVRETRETRRVTVRVERTSDGTQVLARRYDRAIGNDLALQSDIARDVATALSIGALGTPPAARTFDLPPFVRDSMLAVRWLLTRGTPSDVDGAVRRLTWLQSQRPDYAPAWALLSRARRALGDRAGAVEAATHAVHLDSNLAEAQFQFAHAAREGFRHDDATRSYRRAITLAPGTARYHQWLAHHLANRLEFDEAVAHMEFAKRLDPISTAVDFDLYMVYVAAHRWGAARTHCAAVAGLIPDQSWPHHCLLAVTYFTGDRDAAAQHAREIMVLEGADDATFTASDALDAGARLRRYFEWDVARQHRLRDEGGWAPDYSFARAYGRLEDRESVLRYLERIAEARDPSLLWAPREVWFAFLKDDRRFQLASQIAVVR